jgi:hypothetical protein
MMVTANAVKESMVIDTPGRDGTVVVQPRYRMLFILKICSRVVQNQRDCDKEVVLGRETALTPFILCV